MKSGLKNKIQQILVTVNIQSFISANQEKSVYFICWANNQKEVIVISEPYY